MPALTASEIATLRGTFPCQAIDGLLATNAIMSEPPIAEGQVQPASLDLTLSAEAWQVPGSILPLRSEGVRDLIGQIARRKLDLSEPTLLDRDKVYLIRLAQRLKLPKGVGAYTNSKSSIGRIDLATRTLCDHNPRYDKVPTGYSGELWVEVIPKSFDVVVQAGVSLNQAIFFSNRELCSDRSLAPFGPLLFERDGGPLVKGPSWQEPGVFLSLNLDQERIGWVAKKTYEPVDLTKIGTLDPREFFDPIERPRKPMLWLEHGRFYIFSTWEFIRVPPWFAVEMLPYDTSMGEFRAHYAGFFDPGFGHGEDGDEQGTPAVLEVRGFEDDLIIRHRQPICRMVYERLAARPTRLYHGGIGSHYAQQRGPALSKYFRQD